MSPLSKCKTFCWTQCETLALYKLVERLGSGLIDTQTVSRLLTSQSDILTVTHKSIREFQVACAHKIAKKM
jgi:hypothetical protein